MRRLTACGSDKSHPWDTGSGTHPEPEDTGSGEGDGVRPEDDDLDPRMKWHACTDMTEVTAAHFDPSYGYQPIDWDETAEEGRGCRCTLDLMDTEGFALTEPYYVLPVTNVEVRGDFVTDPEHEEVSGQPVGLALRPSWNSDEHYRSETEADDDEEHWRNTRSDTDPNRDWSEDDGTGTWVTSTDGAINFGTDDVDLTAPFYLWLSSREANAGSGGAFAGSRDDYQGIELWLNYDPDATPAGTATPRGENPLPIGIDGARQYLESEWQSVTVTAWNGADRLMLRARDGTATILTPTNASATLAADTFWHGRVDLIPGRVSGTSTWNNPTICVTHSYPTTRSNGNRDVDQAHALTLADLEAAIDDATGSSGLASVVTSATDDDWPVYVVRVQPAGHASVANHTHSLRLEVQGSYAAATLPLQATALGRWDIDVSSSGWSIQGQVARNPGTLTLDLTGGNIGPLQLDATTLVLPAYD